jgi:hypothetical protein
LALIEHGPTDSDRCPERAWGVTASSMISVFTRNVEVKRLGIDLCGEFLDFPGLHNVAVGPQLLTDSQILQAQLLHLGHVERATSVSRYRFKCD